MIELTAGYVAGIIAFAIVISKLVCPTALSFVLAGLLRDHETAGTWTEVARSLHRSHWPTILRSDPYRGGGVRMTVRIMTIIFPLVSILIAITGVITPLGLYEEDEPADEYVTGDFGYVRDAGSFAAGTSPRDGKFFSRTCVLGLCPAPCPYMEGTAVISGGPEGLSCKMDGDVNTTVPAQVREIFTSGTRYSRTTVSNFFDIEWRQLTKRYDREYDNGTPYSVGAFRKLESFALGDQIRVVEGLVVDGMHGGIGFRNHTIPRGYDRGVEWSEDLLFLEPESACVNNNLTFDFSISTSRGQSFSVQMTDYVLTDRGGFHNFNVTSPRDDQRNGENKPDLKTRAYQLAWASNGLTMWYLNISVPANETRDHAGFNVIDSEEGKSFTLAADDLSKSAWKSVDVSMAGSHLTLSTVLDSSTTGDEYANPWGVVADDFYSITSLCQGTSMTRYPRANNTFVMCNQVRGVPRRVDDGPATLFEDGSRWSSPLYTCASAVKATIKSVTFTHNSTRDNLDNLHVKEIKEKSYDNKEDMPLWGFEDWRYPLESFDPVWGIVDSAYEGYPNVSTVRADSLYLIGWAPSSILDDRSFSNDGTWMNLPGILAPLGALSSLSSDRGGSDQEVVDYGAQNSMSLWMRWRDLTSSAEDVPQMFKLMWTDLAASAMTGSKGVMGTGNAQEDQAATIQVLPVVHRVKYHLLFAIPAFLLGVVILFIGSLVFLALLFGKSSLKVMDHRLKQTSMGRVVTTLYHPDSSSFQMPAAQWTQGNAKRTLDMGSSVPVPGRFPTGWAAAGAPEREGMMKRKPVATAETGWNPNAG